MQTLYIDVYFLINLTVDTLALFFAVRMTHIRTRLWRVIAAAFIGACASVIYVLAPESFLPKLAVAIFSLIPIIFVACGRISHRRKAKFALSFLMLSAMLGAAVNFLWGVFDGLIREHLSDYSGGSVNRKLLLMAVAVLISIGVFKMIVAVFSGSINSGNADVSIRFVDKEVRVAALIDSGNLALDPMDMQPILLIKERVAREIFADSFWDFKDPDTLDRNIRRRIRLIPVSGNGKTRVLMGIKADSVKVIGKNKDEEINVTVAIDKEGGNFGGFDALIPATALCNANK